MQLQYEEAFKWCSDKNPDILLLQETHSKQKFANQWCREWGGELIMSHGTSRARGVCICFKKGLKIKIEKERKDKFGRMIIIEVVIKDMRLTICNLYAPNKDQPEFFESVFKTLEEFSSENLLIGGDFNLVLDLDIDKQGGNRTTHEKCQELVLNYMSENKLSDIWRIENPNIKKFTWKSYSQPFIHCRLDFFLVAENLVNKCHKNKITTGFRSDHQLVLTEIKTTENQRGLGFWKFNTQLLNDLEYRAAIAETIENCVYDHNRIPGGTADDVLWEILKCQIRGTSIHFGSKRKKERINAKIKVEKEIQELEAELINTHDPVECNKNIEMKKVELERMVNYETEGSRLRSKCQEYEMGEKSSKYFHSLEKYRQDGKQLKILITDNGEELLEDVKILEESAKFYEDLYDTKIKDKDKVSVLKSMNAYVNTIEGIDSVDKEIDDIDLEFEEDKLLKIIDSFKYNKSPESDGLPIEF